MVGVNGVIFVVPLRGKADVADSATHPEPFEVREKSQRGLASATHAAEPSSISRAKADEERKREGGGLGC